mmetsp:Transcript_107333/g.303451  ORF Transcript_107333/g.303451 Transcript_107333/m.303451 type:complete len:478 (+) Transcript_107333:907-2340(+)
MQMTVQVEGLLRTHGEEVTQMKSQHIEAQDQDQAQLQNLQQEVLELKTKHTEELNQVHELLRTREEELATLKAQTTMSMVGKVGMEDQLNCSQTMLKEKEAENLMLKSELHGKTWELRRIEAQQEKELRDCVEFLKHLAITSSGPALGKTLDLDTAEVLGMGNYGFVLTCKPRGSDERVVVKLQSDRWACVAVKEWAHGSDMSKHPNIVQYVDALMHRDVNMEIETILQRGFDTGVLTGRRPKFFPTCYFCLALEYMDRGTAQSFLDKFLLTTDCIGAITRQIASALSFMHKQKRTHNDIKPENILLRTAPDGSSLVAKLADLGLANHSLDRGRDHELFAYTIWCMGLSRGFQKCPAAEGDRRAAAIKQFQQGAPAEPKRRAVWGALTNVVTGLWGGTMEMEQVADMRELKPLKIKVPEGKETLETLEASARLDLSRRINVSMHRHWKLCHSTSEPNLDQCAYDYEKQHSSTWSPGL